MLYIFIDNYTPNELIQVFSEFSANIFLPGIEFLKINFLFHGMNLFST